MSANAGSCGHVQRSEFILLVHQDPHARASIKKVLIRAGFRRVVVLDTARAAVNKLRLSTSNLLITSLYLPDRDAWTLARIVRSGRFCRKSLPILVLFEGNTNQAMHALAHEHHVRLLSINELHGLPQVVEECMAGDPKPSVLVIEDDESSANLARDCLQHLFEVEIADDGALGLIAYQARRPDLVLLDLRLPGMAGEEVLRQIRGIDPKQPVVVITAHGSLDAHASLMLDGATDFIPKPLDVTHLRQICESALRQRNSVETMAELKEMGAVVKELTGRVYAADHALSKGRTGPASRHLKSAIESCRDTTLTDEEWRCLVDEF